jgi:hypothetical protein
MTSRQRLLVGDGVGVLPEGVVGVSLGAELDGVSLGVVDGLVPEVVPADGVPLGWPEELVDGFLLGAVLAGALGVAAPLGLVAPLAGWEVRAVADPLGNDIRPTVGMPVVGVSAGCWFAVGVPVNAPETSSATSPALARTPVPSAMAVALRRCGGFG